MDTPPTKPDVHVPHFPTYSNARIFLKVTEGYARRTLMKMREFIEEQIGTPQETRDWSEPSIWIPEILTDREKELATRLWEESKGQLNPRHINGLWIICSYYSLCKPDTRDVLQITEFGQDFLNYDSGETVHRIDFSEGLLALLAIVAEHGPGKRSDILPHFTEFLLAHSRVKAPSAVSSMWYARTVNLLARNLIRRDGTTYAIDSKGLDYLQKVGSSFPHESTGTSGGQSENELRRLLEKQAVEVKEGLLEQLRQINPYQLEHVVKTLLEAMGYENVEVTKPSNDGGVDVVGDITIGITYVREVVQVKRHQGNIQRKTLDELRGSLHRFKAYRGTIITTGKFSGGAKQAAFEQGAAPITLIDGERLVDLLIENEIGARKETVSVLKLIPDGFTAVDTEIDSRNDT